LKATDIPNPDPAAKENANATRRRRDVVERLAIAVIGEQHNLKGLIGKLETHRKSGRINLLTYFERAHENCWRLSLRSAIQATTIGELSGNVQLRMEERVADKRREVAGRCESAFSVSV